jgi:hypothetical protein
MEPEIPLPHSQVRATCPYPEQTSNYIIKILTWTRLCSSSLRNHKDKHAEDEMTLCLIVSYFRENLLWFRDSHVQLQTSEVGLVFTTVPNYYKLTHAYIVLTQLRN